MFFRNDKEKACATAIQAIATYMNKMTGSSSISTIDEKMVILQWIYRKIPEINRLLMQIKTEQINEKK